MEIKTINTKLRTLKDYKELEARELTDQEQDEFRTMRIGTQAMPIGIATRGMKAGEIIEVYTNGTFFVSGSCLYGN